MIAFTLYMKNQQHYVIDYNIQFRELLGWGITLSPL